MTTREERDRAERAYRRALDLWREGRQIAIKVREPYRIEREVVGALIMLGYSASEADWATYGTQGDFDARLKKALRSLRGLRTK
jgi:hypothetical protein